MNPIGCAENDNIIYPNDDEDLFEVERLLLLFWRENELELAIKIHANQFNRDGLLLI